MDFRREAQAHQYVGDACYWIYSKELQRRSVWSARKTALSQHLCCFIHKKYGGISVSWMQWDCTYNSGLVSRKADVANNIAHPILNSEAEKRSQKIPWSNWMEVRPKHFCRESSLSRCWFICIKTELSDPSCHIMGTRPWQCSSGCAHCKLNRWAVIYAFPPFSLIQKTLGKLENDQAEGLLFVPHWPTAVWYLQMLKLLIRTPILLPRGKSCSVGPLERSSSSTQTASTSSSLLIRKAVQAQGIHGRTCDICASWREFTKKQYASYLYRWNQFCASRNSDPLRPTVAPVLEFLTKLLDEDVGYSTIFMARSAISAVTQTAIGSHPQITRFLKGVFELRTPLPKYTHTSDVGILLDYFRKQKCSVELSLKELTKQLAALFSSFV